MTKKTALILCILISSVSTSFGQFDNYPTYSELNSLANEYINSKNLDSAILVVEYTFKKFPAEDENTTFYLGQLYTISGKNSKAIEIWKYGMEKGYMYGLTNKAYENYYQDNPDFAKLVEIEKSRNDSSHIKHEVVLPQDYTENGIYPVLFIFHGNGRNIEKAKKSWTSQMMKDKCISIFVQSYSHRNRVDYLWISNDDKTRKEFKEIYDNVMTSYPVDTNKIVFAGMSAGGKIVLDFAFNEFVPMSGVILNCPVVPDNITEHAITQFIEKNKRIGIITGENDFALNGQKELISSISNKKGLSRITINKDIGHTFHQDFPNLLDNYLTWMLE